MNSIIRPREEKDLKELSHDIAVIWNDTYRGIVDDEFLNDLYKNEEDKSYEIMKQLLKDQSTYYVLELDNKIIGWVYFTYDSDYENTGEIHSLYLLKEYQGKGYGRRLFEFAKNELIKKRINKMIIGCLEGNKSNDFYKHVGGKLTGSRLFRKKYKENVYLFNIGGII